MNSGAIWLILAVGFCYLILTLVMPAVFFYKYLKERRFVVRFAFYQVAGNAYVLLWGFIFSFFHIWNEVLVILVLIVLPLLAKLFLTRRDLVRLWLDYLQDKRAKVATSAGALQRVRRFLARKLKEAYYRYIRYHYLEILILLALAVFAVWYYGYFKMHYFTYASSDEATHLYWVNALFAGHPFPVGLYPHSMHFMIASIHSISGMQTLIINHYFSVTIMLGIHFMIFCAVKALFRSSAAAIGSSGLFLFATMFVAQRYHNTLPMEYGFIAMFAMIILLHEFLIRRDKLSMWAAAIVTGWTFHTHFYVTIFCVFIWLAFLLVYLKTIIRLKAVLKTLLIIIVAATVAIAPFGVGVLTGMKFEQSIDWALGVMGVDSEEEFISVSEQNDKMREENAQEWEIETEKESVPEISQAETETEGQEAQQAQEEPEKKLSPYIVEFQHAQTPNDFLRAFSHLLMVKATRNEETARLICLLIGFGFLYGIYKLIFASLKYRKRKKKDLENGKTKKEYRKGKQEFLARNAAPLAVPFFLVFCIFCYSMSYLGLPALIDDSRAAMILSPLLAFIFAAPVSFVEDMLNLIPVKNKRIPAFCLLLAVGAGLGGYYAKAPVKQLNEQGVYFVTQEASNQLSYDLIGTHPRNTWTVISPVNDLLGIHYYGYHYEVIDLLMEIENGNTDIAMPTDDLYIIVEKPVMNAAGVFYLPDYRKDLADQAVEIDKSLIDENYYDLGLPWEPAEEAYSKYRQVTMSKLYYWMEEMKNAYPNEVEVYSEDEFCTIYHIRQNADFPINLVRDYRITNNGVKARDDFERRYAQEHGTELPEELPEE